MADPKPTRDDAIHLARCHRNTGCLFAACDYGQRVKSGQITAPEWDLEKLKRGVAYIVADLLPETEGQR